MQLKAKAIKMLIPLHPKCSGRHYIKEAVGQATHQEEDEIKRFPFDASRWLSTTSTQVPTPFTSLTMQRGVGSKRNQPQLESQVKIWNLWRNFDTGSKRCISNRKRRGNSKSILLRIFNTISSRVIEEMFNTKWMTNLILLPKHEFVTSIQERKNSLVHSVMHRTKYKLLTKLLTRIKLCK